MVVVLVVDCFILRLGPCVVCRVLHQNVNFPPLNTHQKNKAFAWNSNLFSCFSLVGELQTSSRQPVNIFFHKIKLFKCCFPRFVDPPWVCFDSESTKMNGQLIEFFRHFCWCRATPQHHLAIMCQTKCTNLEKKNQNFVSCFQLGKELNFFFFLEKQNWKLKQIFCCPQKFCYRRSPFSSFCSVQFSRCRC